MKREFTQTELKKRKNVTILTIILITICQKIDICWYYI